LPSQATSESYPLDVAVLGPLEAWRRGRSLELGGPKVRSLLAVLALEANQVVSDSQLVEILWGHEPAVGATGVLRVHIHRLRRTIEQDGDHADRKLLVRQLSGYSLVLNTEQVDLGRFRLLIKEARRTASQGDDAQALHLFDAALALWRGPVLADFGDAPFAVAQRTRFDKLRLEAFEDRFDVCLRLGLHHENISAIEALAEEQPLRERLQAQLLLGLYRCGRQAEGSDAYQRTRRRLADELGMEPGPELEATFRDILRQEVAFPGSGDATDRHPHAPETPKRRTNLPAELSSFIGRESQIVEVSDLLASNRHVTLVGPGGIGKTRLALKVAGRLLDRYRDGVCLVDLATVIEAETLAQQILTWLGLREQPGLTPLASLIAILEQRELLLVLDNCDHLVDATSELVQTVLRNCGQVSILATSRERLNCDGEQAWSVPSLGTPDLEQNLAVDRLLEYEAVQLFVERARKARPSFRLTADNARAVVGLCSRLDGIPLAIELAAARSSGLSPAQLQEHLGNRFRLITGSRRALVSRHRTMQETMDWSHRLLTVEEQLLFRRLSVFAGSFDLTAAEEVCADQDLRSESIADLLARLVDKSLIVYADAVAGEGRYRLFETVRQFGQEILASDPSADRIRYRHATHYLNVGEEFERRYRRGEFGRLVRELEPEYGNARAALEWAEGEDVDLFVALAATWWHYWWLQGSLTEGRVWLDRAFGSAGTSLPARARVLCGLGRLVAIQGDGAEAERIFTEGMSLALRADDRVTVATLHNSLGIVALRRDEAAEAEVHFSRAVAAWESLNSPVGIQAAYSNLGESSFVRGEYEQARTHYEAALRIGVEDCLSLATTLTSLANLERHVGNFRAARDHAAEGLRVAHQGEFAIGLASGLHTLALLAAAEGRPFRSTVLAEGAAIITARCGATPDRIPRREDADHCLKEVCGRLDDATKERARHLAAAMSVDEIVTYALGTDGPDMEIDVDIARQLGTDS
jgi:predicted ATPase/DNA-binding SARP family transcriptional activator